ncbi:MAG TPA: hypothetical protein VFA78_07695 [Chloroflexota bacterium]|nr:hypothetical protein [Chloroflexota bacterium]
MEQESRLPEALVLTQDEHTDIRVQAVIQSGRRQVDIRVWRRGVGGMAPVRNGISVTVRDLDAVQTSLDRLIDAGQRQHRVTRFVSDLGEGRRLRAEIEPFGTHFSARLGFWQRVRSSWRPVDDGLVVLCDQLPAIKDTLHRFAPWLNGPDLLATRRALPPSLDRWPVPGADWMTVDADRVALHPRGLHITATQEEETVVIRQWRRADSIWLPEPVSFPLTLAEIETALQTLARFEDEATIPLERSTLCLRREGSSVVVEERGAEGDHEPRLSLSAAALPQFGRLLAESWRLLAPHLSAEEAGIAEPPRLSVAEPIDVVEQRTDALERVEQPTAEPEPAAVVTPLGEVHLTAMTYTLARRDDAGASSLGLTWHDAWLDLPPSVEEDVIASLRSLYYETLRGRRGQSRALSASPALRASVHNRGMQPFLVLEQEDDDHVTELTLPVGEIPAFLDAVQDILTRAQEATCAQGY